jgi:hypothetical protein
MVNWHVYSRPSWRSSFASFFCGANRAHMSQMGDLLKAELHGIVCLFMEIGPDRFARYRQFRQWLSSHKPGFNKLVRRTWHAPNATLTHPIRLIWPSDFYLFLTVKEKLERIQVADEDGFLSACKRFSEVSIKKN